MLEPRFCTHIPFPCPDDPQGCYTTAECHWCPNFDFTVPQLYSLVGPEGENLMSNANRVAQAHDFIRDYGALHSARCELT